MSRFINGIDIDKLTVAPLQGAKSVCLSAPPEAVFAVVSDHARLNELVPGLGSVKVIAPLEEATNGEGTVRYCDFGNNMVNEEKVVLWNPPLAYGYSSKENGPFGFRGHLGLVTCEPDGQGNTILTWRQYFQHDDVAAMQDRIENSLGGIVQNLINRFGGEKLASPTA